ncbi:MAG: hypothetical protein UE295_03305 [Acutalibacteraceae bacterium]|nr:hypothetical protein [Acutalibacteraceae bacterium]
MSNIFRENTGVNITEDIIYYDGRKMSKPSKLNKLLLIIWAIATIVLLGYVIVADKGDNFIGALIWQAVFVISFNLFRYCKIVLTKPFSIIGIFISFSAAPASLLQLQESALNVFKVTDLSFESIVINLLMVLFLSMLSLGFSKQQYEDSTFRRCSETVNATVSRIKRSYVTLGKLNVPVLAYSFNGKRYETVYNRPMDFSKNRYVEGQTAVIKIDPSNPSHIYVAPQSFNQDDVQNQNVDISDAVNDFKNLYENPDKYYNDNMQEIESNYDRYINPVVETNTTYHNRKTAVTPKFSIFGCVFILWFIISMIVGALGAHINPFITLMAFGQIPLVIGVVLFFGIGEGTSHSPAWGGGMFLVGLVLVAIAGINMFGTDGMRLQFEKIAPVLIVSVFNIAGISLICSGPYFEYMNKKHHTEFVIGYVIGLNHKITSTQHSGLIDLYAPIYGYSYKGRKYITESTVYSQSDYPSEGTSRKILINPNNPKEIYEPGRSDTNSLFVKLFGLVFSGMSLFATFLIVAGGGVS